MSFIKKKLGFIKPFMMRNHLMHLLYPHHKGYCTICEGNVSFYKANKWLRDNYRCNRCYSIPRNRALVNALNVFYPDWKKMSLHESSPGGPVSDYLERSCKDYSSSHYYEDIPRGQFKDKFRSEDISAMTFRNETFDLFITSDVFEHVIKPREAFSEIARVLKPGGAHVFTMPWYPELKTTVQRAELKDNKIVHLLEPVYHGNPISNEGSLVTYDWGRDFCDFIHASSGMTTTIYLVKNKKLGLEAEFLEVFVSKKPGRV